MVGVLAASAALEDYTVQPCKKQRKDEDPTSKTITNYFSPLSKTTDKGLSSPKSSNIADYFIRSSPTASKERTTSPICRARPPESPSTPLSGSSKPAGRITKKGRRTKLIKRLSELAPAATADVALNGGGSPADPGTMGSDTAALIAEICSQAGHPGDDDDDVVFQSETSAAASAAKPKGLRGLKRRTRAGAELRLNGEPPTTGTANQPPSVTSNVSPESKTSVGGSSPDHVGTSASLTISFEDFMKSQVGKDQSTSESSTQDLPADSSDLMTVAGGEPSPKTVTVQAQVHLSPPSQNSAKIAAIFKKNKVEKKKGDPCPPECEQTGPALPKRKSNVVIHEEDLELAVIDVETGEPMKHRSTPAERQQFMKAFRQVGEASKANAKKNPARKGTENQHRLQAEEQPSDKAAEDKTHKLHRKKKPPPSLETPETEEQPSDKAAEDKTHKLHRKKKPPPSLETPETETSPAVHSSPVLRRSLRSSRSNPTQSPERTSVESPIFMSTPKLRTPCRKDDLYKAEVLTVPSETESPIRMRFTRVTRRSNWRRPGSDHDNDVFSPGCRKVSKSAKKINKAKKILEKAKAIQQNMVRAETPQRRSTRQRSRGTQEPIVIADTPSSQKNVKKKANLRSLHDVLGKKVKPQSLPPGQKKEVKKKVERAGVITIDDGSAVSENPPDDGQCKAKKEFLMSGLPDSLRRQIARTSAMMEAYSASGSSFQGVLHVQQRDGCMMWNLAMPRCRLLPDLSPLDRDVPDVTRLALSLGDFTCALTTSAARQHHALTARRPLFSDIIRDRLLEEIRLHNPQFPVRRFFNQFLKKQSGHHPLLDANMQAVTPQIEKCIEAAGGVNAADDIQETANGTKRKRKGSPCAKSKRRKAAGNTGDEGEEPQRDKGPTPQPTCSSKGRLSRSSRRKNGRTPAEQEEETSVPPAEGAVCEDVLWTEKYQPQNCSEVIGNSAAIRQLHSWLREWKIRAEKEEKRNQMQKTVKDDTWTAGDSEDSDEDSLCNTVLICGPPGVGKTAAVYACAQELGFKVFEVNASCQRSGRQILAQLKEATQSHQVDQQGVNAHRPCFFSSPSTSKSPRKLNSPKTVVSSPRKPPASPRGAGLKRGLAPKSLTNFFKAATKPEIKKNAAAELVQAPQSGDGNVSRPLPLVTDKGTGVEESQRKTATSLILFEEVDVIFDDDLGFLSAIKTFMSTTKRPVILTTSDPTFLWMFDGVLEQIFFRTPSVVNVASFLQVLCLSENLRTDAKDLITFLTANKCDIRQSVLQLQFWARSGGGGRREKQRPGIDQMERTEAADGAAGRDPTELPGCNVGCAEHLLGVNNILAPAEDLVSFVREKDQDAAGWNRRLQLLTELHTRNVYFTPSNLEFLLPLPVHVEEPAALENPEPARPPDDDSHTEDASVKRSATMKRRRKLALLNDSDLFESDSNSVDEVLTAITREPEENSPRPSDTGKEAAQVGVMKRTLSPAELQSSLLVYQCLDSMAEFTDNMSSLDCSTCNTADPALTSSPRWTESRLKHGLCDGLRTESRDLWSAQSCGEVRALIEALSFQKCSSTLSKTLESSLELCKQSGNDPTEELTLRVTKAREQVYFGQPAATTDVAESRLSVVKDVLSNRAFISLGNRDVNVTEYLPALRNICRLQKAKEEGKTKRRFLHYLEGLHLELPKATLSRLAADFP